MLMKINPVEDIIATLLLNKQGFRNFPKTLNFPFDRLYIDLVTQIKTTEISAECILFDSVQAVNENKDFLDSSYWKNGHTKEMIAVFWIFGQNGQGDLWLFDNKNEVYFYDHNQGEMGAANFVQLGLNFENWLQFADLNKQLDHIFEVEHEISEEHRKAYQNKLSEISETLLNQYPFEL